MAIEHDIVAILAADIASPRVVAAIDKAVELNEQQRVELLALRKMAVRLHGEAPAAPHESETPKGKRQGGEATIESLALRYRTDQRSPYHRLRHRTRETYDSLIRRLVDDCGKEKLAELKAPDIQRFYDGWIEGGKIAMGHSLITMLRAFVTFGMTVLDDAACERLSLILHNMRFSVTRSSREQLTAEHIRKIISKAHELGRPSIALAQAFQFECGLRQKDVIGEWVPITEPGTSEVISGKEKWLRGLRWSEIDRDLVLRHVTSKGGKLVEKRLSEAPLIKAEFARIGPLPQSGPIIICEPKGIPWTHYEFRRWWRKVADAAGVPKKVKNMDSRVATSEATNARDGTHA